MDTFLVILRVIADYGIMFLGLLYSYNNYDPWVWVPLVFGYIILFIYTEALYHEGKL